MERGNHQGRNEARNDAVADPIRDRDMGSHRHASAGATGCVLLHSEWKKPFSPIRHTSVSAPRSASLRAASTANSIASALLLYGPNSSSANLIIHSSSRWTRKYRVGDMQGSQLVSTSRMGYATRR